MVTTLKRIRSRFAFAALAFAALGACGGGDGPTPPQPVPVVRSVQLSPATSSIRVGETQPLTAAVDVANGAGTGLNWTSEASNVATVSAAGVVTAVAPGTATIRATSTFDSKVSGTAQVQVTALRAITVTPATTTINTGEQRTLTADIQLEAGANRAVTWRTSDATRVSVTQAGVVTGVAVGSATISVVAVVDTNVRGTALVTVSPSVRTVTVAPATANLFINGTQQLTPTVTADGGLASTVTWRTSNAAVATVSATGLVTAVALGQATITTLSTVDTTKRATAAITVTARPLSVAIVQRNVGINPGTSTQLTVNVSADPGVSTGVNWSSSSPGIATVSNTGLVAAVSSGSTLITAVSQADASKRDTVTVSVVPRLANSWTASRVGGALYEDILSIAAFSASSAFAVNSVGDIYRWNGTSWTQSLRGATMGTQFEAMQGTSASNIIAVGSGGVIARWDGTAWTKMTSPTANNLFSVYMDSPTTAFAVGATGTVIRLNGSTWTALNSGSTRTLYGVWANAGSAMIVGTVGEVLRYDGTTFMRMDVSLTETLFNIGGSSINTLVAVGSSGTVLRFDGTAWTLVNSNGITGNVWAAVPSAGARVYLATDDGLFVLDGQSIAPALTPYAPRMYAASVDAGGILWTGGQRAVVQRGTPSASTASFETINLAPDLLDVWTTAANSAWAVGEFGFIYRWNGTSWTRQTAPTTATLVSVWAASATDAFAGGDNGVMLRYNGTAWSTMTLPTTAPILSIWGTSSSNVYAATAVGEVLRFNGTAWSIVTTSQNALWAVFGAGATEVYASGESGTVLRFNGTTWSPFASPGTGTLAGIWMTGPTNVLVVGADASGANGVSYRYNGTAWQAMPVGTNRLLTSIWGPSLADVYVTGDLGTLLRFDGTTWQSVNSGATDLLWSLSGSPDGVGGAFAVGYNGTLVTGSSNAGFAAVSSASGSRVTPGSPSLRFGGAVTPTARSSRCNPRLRALVASLEDAVRGT